MLDEIRRGPQWRVVPAAGIGFGSVLVHREVFEDIAKTQPDVLEKNSTLRDTFGYKYAFFRPTEDQSSDDYVFCQRAKKAGHDAFIDLALMPGHVGNRAFTYKDIKLRL